MPARGGAWHTAPHRRLRQDLNEYIPDWSLGKRSTVMATYLRFRFGHHTMTGRRTKRLCEICDLSIWRRIFRQKKWRAPQEHPPEIDNMDEEETISMRLMRLCQSCDIKASAQITPEFHSVNDENAMHSRHGAAVITNKKAGPQFRHLACRH